MLRDCPAEQCDAIWLAEFVNSVRFPCLSVPSRRWQFKHYEADRRELSFTYDPFAPFSPAPLTIHSVIVPFVTLNVGAGHFAFAAYGIHPVVGGVSEIS